MRFVQAHIAKASAQERAAAKAEAAAAAASAEAAAAALAETDAVREEWRQSEAALAARHEAELQSTDERWQRKLQEVRSCRFQQSQHMLMASAPQSDPIDCGRRWRRRRRCGWRTLSAL